MYTVRAFIVAGLVTAGVVPMGLHAQRARRSNTEPRPAIYRASDGTWRVDLPPAMEDALDRYDRDFEPWSLGDYSGMLRLDDREYAFSPRQTPWAVIGDFNGDGRPDLAIAGRTDEDALVLLVLSNGRRKYRVVELESEPYDPDDRRSIRPALLQYLYPGRYVIEDARLRHPRELVVDLPAVQVIGARRQGATLYVVENNTVLPYYLSDQPAPLRKRSRGSSKTPPPDTSPEVPRPRHPTPLPSE